MNKQLDINSNPTSEKISIYYAFLWSKGDHLNSEWDRKEKVLWRTYSDYNLEDHVSQCHNQGLCKNMQFCNYWHWNYL